MIIEGSFYKIIPIDSSSPFYDLELLYSIGGKNPRKEFKNEAYGITLESALNRCAHFAVRNKYNKEDIITLKEYLEEFKKAKEDLCLDMKKTI